MGAPYLQEMYPAGGFQLFSNILCAPFSAQTLLAHNTDGGGVAHGDRIHNRVATSF